ncbi:MAG: hypothetical protein ACRDG3_05055 [Tepidiformaceae bacterium]
MKTQQLSRPVEADPIVASALTALRAQYESRLRAVAVWTPSADCDSDEDPDVEVIAVLEDGFDRDDEVGVVSAIASSVGIEHGVFLLIVPVGEPEFRAPGVGRRGVEIQGSVRVA